MLAHFRQFCRVIASFEGNYLEPQALKIKPACTSSNILVGKNQSIR